MALRKSCWEFENLVRSEIQSVAGAETMQWWISLTRPFAISQLMSFLRITICRPAKCFKKQLKFVTNAPCTVRCAHTIPSPHMMRRRIYDSMCFNNKFILLLPCCSNSIAPQWSTSCFDALTRNTRVGSLKASRCSPKKPCSIIGIIYHDILFP